jgi:hypothetical protein
MGILNSGIPTSTERNYNLEFCKELTTLIMERAGRVVWKQQVASL